MCQLCTFHYIYRPSFAFALYPLPCGTRPSRLWVEHCIICSISGLVIALSLFSLGFPYPTRFMYNSRYARCGRMHGLMLIRVANSAHKNRKVSVSGGVVCVAWID